MRKLLSILSVLFFALNLNAQKVLLDGYVYEKYNRGFLNEVKISILDESETLIGETLSDIDGHFQYEVPAGKDYYVDFAKKVFNNKREKVSTKGKEANEKVFVKAEMERQPGYLLEVTLAEKRLKDEIPVDAVNGSRIEIYNNTAKKSELVIDSTKSPVFSYTLQQGNEYTILIRKKGFYNKRLHANVNINGCYLCMDGFGTVNPGVVSNLTSAENNKLGTLIANVELEPIDMNRNIVLRNIYYGYNSADITEPSKKELDKVITLLKNNPSIIVELGSHTDSRGTDDYNLRLSQMRAQSAVDYITTSGKIPISQLKAKGYGETKLVNKCANGLPCSEEQHLQNRRTELKVLGFTKDTYDGRTLVEIMHDEELQHFVNSGESDKVYSSTPNHTTAPNTPLPSKSTKTPPSKIPAKSPIPTKKEASKLPSSLPKEDVIKTTTDTFDDTPQKTNIEEYDKVSKPTPTPSVKLNTPNKNEELKPQSAVTFSKIGDFTGYKIEVFNTPNALDTADPDLKMIAQDMSAMGVPTDIFQEPLKTGNISYMVGYYQGWSETETALEKINKKYPYARIIEYFKGKRLSEE